MLIYLQMIENSADKSKFEQIYNTYRGLMFYIANHIVHNSADAEDAVHQAFLSILENLQKIKEVKSPKTKSYIVIITERKALDIIRAQKRTVDYDFDNSTFGIDIPLPGDNGLADAMTKLPAKYREILLLRYAHGYNTRELSQIFHTTAAAAQKMLWRAKRLLGDFLEQEEDEA